MKKRQAAAVLICVTAVSLLMGCEERKNTQAVQRVNTGLSDSYSEPGGTITFAIWENMLNEAIEELDMIGRFQEQYPNVDIEIEMAGKDDSEYWNVMEMRASANQLPDIMFNKPFTLSRFEDYMLDLSETEACTNNLLAKDYALDGKVVGIPMTFGHEYVYYWKDMFKEAGVEVPTTWPEYVEMGKELQEYYGRDDPDFAAVACGLKDEWQDYPYMENMPMLESANGQYWNDMAVQTAPFAEGTDIYKAFHKIYDLFSSGALGKNPLGLSSNQAYDLFAAKKAAAIAIGDWGLEAIVSRVNDVSQLGTFYLPARDTEADPFNVIALGDSFMGVTTHSRNPEAAMAFLEWFYSDAWYPDLINRLSADSSMKTFQKEMASVQKEADERCPDRVLVMYGGCDNNFIALQKETLFDYKKLGAQMLLEDFDLDTELEELNEKWAEAKSKLNM